MTISRNLVTWEIFKLALWLTTHTLASNPEAIDLGGCGSKEDTQDQNFRAPPDSPALTNKRKSNGCPMSLLARMVIHWWLPHHFLPISRISVTFAVQSMEAWVIKWWMYSLTLCVVMMTQEVTTYRHRVSSVTTYRWSKPTKRVVLCRIST